MQDSEATHEEHLLDLALGFGVAGAVTGGLVTVLTLVPAQALVAAAPGALPLALAMLMGCTCGVLLSGTAYLGRRLAAGRLDARVGRALPLAFLLLVPMVAPWSRLVVAFPRFVEAAFAVSFLAGGVTLASLWTAVRSTNRLSQLCAAVNVCQYGALAAGLGLAGGPVALAGLSAAAAALGLLLMMVGRGAVAPGLLGGPARGVPRAALGCLMVIALSLSGLGVHAALAPEAAGHCAHRAGPVLLRGAVMLSSAVMLSGSVVTFPPADTVYRGCRPVDDED